MIIDEAQNTTPVQMKMVLTRLGQGSRMVITGDLSQIDLPDNQPSGLADAVDRLKGVEGVGIIHLSGKDVVRHTDLGSSMFKHKQIFSTNSNKRQ